MRAGAVCFSREKLWKMKKRKVSSSGADTGSDVTNLTVVEAKEFLLRHLHLKNDSEFTHGTLIVI